MTVSKQSQLKVLNFKILSIQNVKWLHLQGKWEKALFSQVLPELEGCSLTELLRDTWLIWS